MIPTSKKPLIALIFIFSLIFGIIVYLSYFSIWGTYTASLCYSPEVVAGLSPDKIPIKAEIYFKYNKCYLRSLSTNGTVLSTDICDYSCIGLGKFEINIANSKNEFEIIVPFYSIGFSYPGGKDKFIYNKWNF